MLLYVPIILVQEKVDYFENYNLCDIVTLVDAGALERMLKNTHYPEQKINFLIRGFKRGFDLQYVGDRKVTHTAPNLKFTVGNKFELWNKVMNEVKLKRYAGLYSKPPFDHYIQSPIALVPEDQGRKTRLIFHLSYITRFNGHRK